MSQSVTLHSLPPTEWAQHTMSCTRDKVILATWSVHVFLLDVI